MGGAKAQHSPSIEDEYHSASDEDFDPNITHQAADDGSSTSDECERSAKCSSKRRKATPATGTDFNNSGDESTIRKGRKKRRKGKAALEDLDHEVGGDGGLVKTRAQMAKEKYERKPPASTGDSTIDVDALWASMSAPTTVNPSINVQVSPVALGIGASNGCSQKKTSTKDMTEQAPVKETPLETVSDNVSQHEDMVAIKRTYAFAGETITEEKLVLKDSAEARLYCQSEQNSPYTQPKSQLRRPKKRSSMFEPNPGDASKTVTATDHKGPKLNTIEKSKLDWAGYVDKEGIADDLDEHSRAKEGYLGRMDFLGRVEAKREQDLKNAQRK